MYNYEEEKKKIFTEEAQVGFLSVRDKSKALLKTAGSFSMGSVISGVAVGDSWQAMAFVDRLVELGEIREITDENVAGQHRVFVVKN